jgi:hypothetical protein
LRKKSEWCDYVLRSKHLCPYGRKRWTNPAIAFGFQHPGLDRMQSNGRHIAGIKIASRPRFSPVKALSVAGPKPPLTETHWSGIQRRRANACLLAGLPRPECPQTVAQFRCALKLLALNRPVQLPFELFQRGNRLSLPNLRLQFPQHRLRPFALKVKDFVVHHLYAHLADRCTPDLFLLDFPFLIQMPANLGRAEPNARTEFQKWNRAAALLLPQPSNAGTTFCRPQHAEQLFGAHQPILILRFTCRRDFGFSSVLAKPIFAMRR